MDAEQQSKHSRRAVLAAAAGAAAATVIAAIERPSKALAGTDGDVVLGAENYATTPTEINAPTPNAFAVGASGENTAIHAIGQYTGVYGFGVNGWGVHGETEFGSGVDASAPIENTHAAALVVRGRAKFGAQRPGHGPCRTEHGRRGLPVRGLLGPSARGDAPVLRHDDDPPSWRVGHDDAAEHAD
jgi:hypothetical protein